MPYRLISQQMLLEHEVVARLCDALRTAVAWNQHGDLSRKLTSIQFLAQSFERHVERMFELEEHDGYIDHVEKAYPQYGAQIAEFRSQHDRFRREIAVWIEQLADTERMTSQQADALFENMLQLLHEMESHNEREMNLLEKIIVDQPSSE